MIKVVSSVPKRAAKRAKTMSEKDLANFTKLAEQLQGTLSIGINPNKKYYKGRKKPVRVASAFIWNEFGTKDGRVPERPVLRNWWRTYNESYTKSIQTSAGMFLSPTSGETRSWMAIITRLGNKMVANIKTSLAAWRRPKNADYTIRAKGFDNPFIWTRTLLNSWQWRWTPSGEKLNKKLFRDIGAQVDRIEQEIAKLSRM